MSLRVNKGNQGVSDGTIMLKSLTSIGRLSCLHLKDSLFLQLSDFNLYSYLFSGLKPQRSAQSRILKFLILDTFKSNKYLKMKKFTFVHRYLCPCVIEHIMSVFLQTIFIYRNHT